MNKLNLNVEVTERDIKNGVPCSIEKCPVARAIKRTARCRHVDVTSTHLGCEKGGKCYSTYKVPKRVSRFINAFDEAKTVRPFTFNCCLNREE